MKLIEVGRQWCRKKFHDYVVFTKSIFFLLGLIFGYKLVEKSFMNILITHLTGVWEDNDLRRAVIVVNFQEGASAVLVPVFALVADVYTGRFYMVAFSTAVCIIGLLLNFVADRNDPGLDLGLFYPALGLMTLAEAALTVALRAFLDDQLRPSNQTPAATAANDDDTRRDQLRPRDLTLATAAPATANGDDPARDRRSNFWWNSVSFVAAIFVQFGPLANLEFRKLAIVLTAVMGGCFLVFLLGSIFKCYNCVLTIENPFKDVIIVIFRAIANRNVYISDGHQDIWPRIPWLRWLDRAAIVSGTEAPSSDEQVRGVKLLLKMLPLWFCFITVSLVAASGSTFFFEEAASLAGQREYTITPIYFFANLQRFTEFVVSETCNCVLKKLGEKKNYNEQNMELVRIGVGVSCAVPCCIAAWAAAKQRQDERENVTMSVYHLTPQYLLLGIMGGLARDGLESFYKSQVSESLSRFGPSFGELMMEIGKFISIVCIFIFSTGRFKWFQKDLDNSRLDKYYVLLAILSFWNVIIYCLVGRWCRDDEASPVEDEEMGTIAQEPVVLADGAASPSIEGKHISLRSLSRRRTVSKGRDRAALEIRTVTKSSNSRQEEEAPENQLLGSSEPSKNIST